MECIFASVLFSAGVNSVLTKRQLYLPQNTLTTKKYGKAINNFIFNNTLYKNVYLPPVLIVKFS